MYVVALNANTAGRRYSMTVRDLDRSLHWKHVADDVIRDTRELEHKPFNIMYSSILETDARKFATVVDAAYKQAGYEKTTVKVSNV